MVGVGADHFDVAECASLIPIQQNLDKQSRGLYAGFGTRRSKGMLRSRVILSGAERATAF